MGMLEGMIGDAALVDRSERGKLSLSGADAAPALNGIVSNEVEGLEPGSGVMAAVLTPKGRMLGDVRVLSTGEELLLDMERVALQPVFDALRHGLVGYRAELGKRTLQQGLLSLLGPGSREVAGAQGLGKAEHCHVEASLAGLPVRLIATELGVDVLCAAEDLDSVRAELLVRGAAAAGEDEAELLRVESGRPRYGVDLDDTVIPQEAGLNDRLVSFTKGCYVGQETVARLFYKGKPNRHLRGLRLSEPLAAGAVLTLGDREVGRLTSSVVSPALGPIGLALVRREAEPGATVSAGDGGATATIVELPFHSRPTRRVLA